MVDFVFKPEEFQEVVNDLIPSYQKSLITNAIALDSSSESDFDQIGLSLTGEQTSSGFVILTGIKAKDNKSIYSAIKSEIYDLLCTSSKKYDLERKDGGATIKNLVTIIATAVAGSFNIAIGVIVGAVTVALMGALKIGKNAWCEINKPQI